MRHYVAEAFCNILHNRTIFVDYLFGTLQINGLPGCSIGMDKRLNKKVKHWQKEQKIIKHAP